MEAAGIGDKTPQAIQLACKLALQAREEAELERNCPASPAVLPETRMETEGDRKVGPHDKTTALQRRHYFVAGSLSTHPPAMPKGTHDSTLAIWPSPEEEQLNYIEAATSIAGSGVDFLFLEMMKDLEHAPRAIKAAGRCGLPIFLGISARLDGPEKK